MKKVMAGLAAVCLGGGQYLPLRRAAAEFDDFEEGDDSLVMTDNALASFSSLLGYDLVSCRLRMDGARFASVTVIVQYDGRMEMAYAFSDYGSTSVQLPA